MTQVTELTEKESDRRIAFYTLGCKLNYAETAMISSKFQDRGYKKVGFDKDADVYVINTCSVTQVADKKCRHQNNNERHDAGKIHFAHDKPRTSQALARIHQGIKREPCSGTQSPHTFYRSVAYALQ